MTLSRIFSAFLYAPFSTNTFIEIDKLNSDWNGPTNWPNPHEDTSSQDLEKLTYEEENDDPFILSLGKRTKKMFELEKVELPNYDHEINGLCKLKFKNSTVSFFPCGTGIFSTQVTLTFQDCPSISSIRKAENKMEMIVKEFFEKEIIEHKKSFFHEYRKFALPDLSLESEPFDVDNNNNNVVTFPWIHKIYWFHKTQFFNGYDLQGDIYADICELLQQKAFDMSPFLNLYAFYGWGRSAIISKSALEQDEYAQISRILEMMKITQYVYFGLYQLQKFLTKKVINLKAEAEFKKLREQIEWLNSVRFVIIRYIEEFRYDFNTLFEAGEHLLLEYLQKQWRIEALENSIRSKLDLAEKELGTMEQLLVTEKQDRLNKVAQLFTVITLLGVLAQVVILSPIKEMFPERTYQIFPSPFLLVLSVTGALFLISILIYSKGMRSVTKRIRQGGATSDPLGKDSIRNNNNNKP
jgi:hypothetical protein